MQCSHCGKNDWVTIGNQNYCTHCGNPADSSSTPAAAASPITPPPTPVAATKPIPQKPEPAAPPAKPGAVFSDLSTAHTSNPAAAVHSGASATTGVLDLRQMSPKPVPVEPSPQIKEPVMSAPEPVAPVAAPQPTTVAADSPKPKEAKLAQATAIPKSDMIKKFSPPAAPAPIPSPTEPLASPAPAPVPTAADPIAAPPVVAPAELPNQVITQINAQNQAATPAHDIPANLRPKPATVMATTLAIALMGGYIWFNNLNTLTVRAAGQKAGISASLPSYLPTSYSLSGPISYGSGYVSLQFKSPANPSPMVITQRKTDWNSASLLTLFVSPKSQSYVTVQDQGLTIYLYNNNQATWVNRGVQYTIEGATALSKESIVKVAESL